MADRALLGRRGHDGDFAELLQLAAQGRKPGA